MRKSVVLTLMFIFLISSSSIYAYRFSLKLGTSFYSGGKLTDEWITTTDYFIHQVNPGKSNKSGNNLFVEMVFFLNSYFSVSVGGEYLSSVSPGSRADFTYPVSSEFSGTSSYSPDLQSAIYAVPISAIFTFNIVRRTRINIFGGVGYYFGELNCLSSNWSNTSSRNENIEWSYFDLLNQSKISSIGYHFGTGFNIGLSPRSFIFVEVLYRIVDFTEFDTERSQENSPLSNILPHQEELEGDSTTFLYLSRVGGTENMGEMAYRVSKFNLSGISLRIGIKFNF